MLNFWLAKLLTGRENGSQKGITGREFGSQNHLPDVNLALKNHYRTGIWLSNIITGRELGSQISLPDENWALKYHYRTWVWLSISFKQTNFFTSKMVNNLQINVSPCSKPVQTNDIDVPASDTFPLIVQAGERDTHHVSWTHGYHCIYCQTTRARAARRLLYFRDNNKNSHHPNFQTRNGATSL